jgi:hypothetical protein
MLTRAAAFDFFIPVVAAKEVRLAAGGAGGIARPASGAPGEEAC